MKAVLLFDPNRRRDQLAFVRERAKILHEFGDRVWVSMAEEQTARFTAKGIQVQPQEGADLIQLPAIVFDPEEAKPAPPAELAATEPTGDDTAYYVVQFAVAPEPDWIQAIQELRGVLVEDVPVHAAVFTLTSQQAAGVRGLGEFVSWVGLYHPAYALSFELAGRKEPFSAAGLSDLRADPERFASVPEGAVRVSFFSDRDIEDRLPAVEAAGAEVVADRGFDLVINVPVERVPALLRTPGVRALEPHRPPTLSNQRAGMIMGANQVRNFGKVDFLVNLDGSGEIVGVFDSGLDNGVTPTTHTDFNVFRGAGSRIISIDNLNRPPPSIANPNPPPYTSQDFVGHGTHVTGSIAGNGQNAPPPTDAKPNNSVPRGIAPACRVVFTSGNASNPPLPPSEDFSKYMKAFENHYAAGARVHSNSWGGEGHNIYDNDSATIDRFAFLKPDAVVLFAAGNDEADLNDSNVFDQNSLGGKACGKNTLVIGASENVTSLDGDGRPYLTAFGFHAPAPNCVRFGIGTLNPIRIAAIVAGTRAPPSFPMSNNADDLAMFSCRGRVKNPATPARRRVKPDLVAPGTNILSTLPVGLALPANIGQVCPPVGGATIAVANPQLAVTTAPAAFYFVLSGTSMATPLAAGACLLVRQFYRQRFGQLRRPLLLEKVERVEHETAFVDLPAAAPHTNGCVLAWIHRDAGARQNHLVAAQYSRRLVRATPIVRIATNVGGHPAIALARHGGNTLVLHRDGANVLQLSLRDHKLDAVAAFGAAGTVTLTPASRPEDDRRPTVAVRGDEIGVVWFQTGTENLVFQRFRADTGKAIDAAAKVIGAGTHTSNHPYLAYNGSHWAAFWGRRDGADFHLMMRFIDDSGNPEGAQPLTLLKENDEIREPHAVWEARQGRFLLAFVSAAAAPNRGVRTLLINADGSVSGDPTASVTSKPPPAAASRRPRLGLHPDSGFVLLWEDNREGKHDLYFSFLDPDGMPTGVKRMQISDTPNEIDGYSALVDADGILPVWQSNDEINSDLKGVYALAVTKNGVFQAQADPATPLLERQFYVRQTLNEHADVGLVATAMAWGGGDFFLLRPLLDGANHDLYLVRTDADGKPDDKLAPLGAVCFSRWIGYEALCLFWTGSRLLVAGSSFGPSSRIYLLESDDSDDRRLRLVESFGTSGTLTLSEPASDQIFLQVAQRGAGADFLVFVVYGRFAATGPHTIRYTVRDATGGGTLAPRDLVKASGTAKQGWFHLVESDIPVHCIAAWHIEVDDHTAARVNRFQLNGDPQAGVAAPIPLTGLKGDAKNPVIAPRLITSALGREYGAAWQHRPAGANWQIMFSRLQRDGRPSTTAGQFDVAVVQNATDHATEPQLVWHTDGYGLAWVQQPIAGGHQQLFFTILDVTGHRPNLAATGARAAPATDFAVSAASADVKRFHLIWTGDTFRITWTEVENGKLRHRQMALAVPRRAGGTRYDAPFQQPSSALIRATLINGATNIRHTPLPNVGNDVNDGYGWGRVNLRQALAPAPPVTFHVRDDGVVATGRTARYEFELLPDTQFLRITLAWTDPPGNDLVNHLHLKVTTPAFAVGGVRVFHGNRWQTTKGRTHLSAPLEDPKAPPPYEDIHNVQQVVISGPPALPEGTYIVEVVGNAFGRSSVFPGQPFALVFVGSGRELRMAGPRRSATRLQVY